MPRGPKGEKRPADVIGNAVHVMRIATGEIKEAEESAAALDVVRLIDDDEMRSTVQKRVAALASPQSN
jgi:hypothetical protein